MTEVSLMEGLADLMASLTLLGEELHGRHAVETVKAAKNFANSNETWEIETTQTIANATGNDLRQLLSWRAQMEADINRQNGRIDQPVIEQEDKNVANVTCLENIQPQPRPAEVTHIEYGNEESEMLCNRIDRLRENTRKVSTLL